MTARAVVAGLLGAAFVAAVTYFNDNIIRQTPFIGNHLPHSVYGLLIVFVLGVNPLLSRLGKRLAFSGAEIAVALGLALAACAVPGWGLMKHFPNSMMLPHQMARTKPSWEAENILRETPEYMLAGSSAAFREGDFLRPVRTCEALSGADEGGPGGALRARIRSTLSDPRRQSLRDALRARDGESDEARALRCRRALVAAFNSLLHEPDLYHPEALEGVKLPPEAEEVIERVGGVRRRPGDPPPRPGMLGAMEPRDLRALNRHLIDAAFAREGAPDDIYSRSQRRHDELQNFVFGKSFDRSAVGVSEVPWSAWARPLAFWLPLFLIFSAGLIGLSLVVHRQWSDHEVLQYPIARFTEALLPGEDGASPGVLRNRMFLWAAGIVFAVRMLNYADQWTSGSLVSVPTSFDFTSLQDLFPVLGGPVAAWGLFTLRVFPAVVGLGYFLATDVSLSLGIATPIAFYVGGLFAYYGFSLAGGGGLYSGSPIQVFTFGAYLGLLIMLVYTGRSYYRDVFGAALRLRRGEGSPPEAVWGARVFMACAAAMLAYLLAIGVDWILAVPYVLLAFGIFLVMGRIIATTGLFFLEPRIYPCAFLVVMFGIRAVGPRTALLMFLVSTVLMVVPRESLMPFVVNSLRVFEGRRVPLGRAAAWCGAAVVVALLVAVPVTLSIQYGAGTNTWDSWAGRAVPRYSFDKAVQHRQRLRAQGELEASDGVRGLARLGRIAPVRESVIGFACGLLLVVGLSAARLRWPKWPIHPVIAIGVWNYPATMFYCSFLIAFLVKGTVTKYWGQEGQRRLAPAMVGLVADDMLGMVVIALVGTVYYLFTGTAGPACLVMPE